MNSNMGTSGCSSTSVRQGFYDETEKSKHHHPSPQYPSSNSSSHHHHNLHRSWLDSHMGGGRGVGGEGGSNSPLDHLMMDSSPTHVSRTTTTTGGGGGEDAEESQSQTIMRELGQEVGGQSGVAAAVVVEKEHMFDKVVTPSDVGKLNRLVIPKQHAERYFPLDSSTNEKGLLLNFEDRNGKPWRFRYSYWNSSQSYVMTKGWSRFVKEKKLDAGDIVSFQRGVGELAKDRLFIDWRRRPDAPPQELLNPVLANLSFPHHFSFQRSSNSSSSNMNIHHHPWNPMFLQTHQAGVPVPPAPPYSQQRGAHHAYSNSHLLQPQSNYINNMSTSTSSYGAYGGGGPVGPYGYNISGNSTSHVVNPCSSSVIYFRSASAAPQQQLGMVQMQRASHGGFHVPSSPGGIGIGIGNDPPPVVFESVPVVHGKAAAKRLRLFGVNMDCAMPPEDEGNECEILTPTTNTAAAATDQIMNMSYYNAHPPMCFEGYTTQNHYICSSNSSTSSSSTIPYLQLRPYSGTQIQTLVQQYPPSSSSTTSDKGKASMSLDLDI